MKKIINTTAASFHIMDGVAFSHLEYGALSRALSLVGIDAWMKNADIGWTRVVYIEYDDGSTETR